METLLRQYLEKVIKEHKKLDSRGVMQVSRFIELDLNDIFIPLLLRKDAEFGLPRFGLDPREPPGPEGQIRQAQLPFDFDGRPVDKDLKLADLFQRNRRWAVLGDPGAGKSTLLKHHALETARAFLDGTGDRLPVYVTLRYFAEVWLNKNPSWLPENALLAYLVEDGLKELGFADFNERQRLAAQIRSAAEDGKLLLLLDGMDEERDRDSKRQTGLAAAGLLRLHAENRCLVSSRIVGFEAAALADHFETATLQAFSPDQRNAYLRQWLLAVEKAEDIVADQATEERARRKADDLIAQLDAVPGLAALAANPLLCTIIGLIYHQGGALPQQRIELYKLCVDTFIFNWEMTKRRKGLGAEAGLNPEETQAVLEPIALHFQQDCPENRASRPQILRIMSEFLTQETGLSAAQAERKAAEQLDLIREVAGLFIDRGEEEYGFFHLTFQEYLAARAITRKRREIERHVHKHAFDPRWREVLKLAAAHQGWKSAEDGSEFIETVLSVSHPHNQKMEYSFRLAFACMREARVEAKTQHEMVESWVKNYILKPWLQKLLLNLACRNGRSILVSKEAMQPLIQALDEESAAKRGAAILALGALGKLSDQARPMIIPRLLQITDRDGGADPPNVRQAATEALGYFPGTPEIVRALSKSLEDEDRHVREMAVRALGKLKEFKLLCKALNDYNWLIRVSAVHAISQFSTTEEALPILLDSLADAEWSVRYDAARIIRKFSDAEDLLIRILQCLQSESWSARAGAAEALGQLPPTSEALEPLLVAVRDPHPDVRAAAIWALHQYLDNSKALEAIHQILTHGKGSEQVSAAMSLSIVPTSHEGITFLIDGIHNESKDIRYGCVSGIGALVPISEAIGPLIGSMLNDDDVLIRGTSANTLSRFPAEREIFNGLLKACEDEDWLVRTKAAQALGKYPCALNVLFIFLENERLEVQYVISRSIERIEMGTPL